MARAFASGTLTSAAPSADIHVPDKYTGEFGLLLTGTWGPATFRTRPGSGTSAHPHIYIDPADGTRSSWSTLVAGLYFLQGYFSDLRLSVTGADGTTDIDWVLFLKPRP